MTPTKSTGKKTDDTRKQPLREATATPNLAEMTSQLEVAGPSSQKVATKRPITFDEEVLSAKKSKFPPKDISDEAFLESDDEEKDMETAFTFVTKKRFFEDRTLIIKDFVESENELVIDNKPHRFGKTTNVYSMVLYLSKFIQLRNQSLFKGLKIGKETQFEKKYFKQCKVFYLNLRVDKDDHVFDVVAKAFKSCFDDVKQHFPECDVEFNPEKMSLSLTALMSYVKGPKRFTFIDEYDSAFIELYELYRTGSEEEKVKAKRYAEQIYAFIDRSSRDYACRFLLTGIACLEFVDFFSDPSMIFGLGFDIYNRPWREYHMISMEEFVNSKGFETESKPDSEKQAKLRKWYGGYTFISDDRIIDSYLNLYSIIQYYSHYQFREYFTTSGCTKWLRKFLQREDVILYVNEILSATGKINIDLRNKPFLHGGRNDVLSLLVKCGYLVLDSNVDEISSYDVKIPNLECQKVLKWLVGASFSNYLPPEKTSDIRKNLYEAFKSGNEDLLRTATENFFAAVQGNIRYEETYGLLFYNALQDFPEIRQIPYDTPAGGGKCDGVIQVKGKAYVVEFKRCQSSDLPEPDKTSPEEYDAWCSDKGEELIERAENQLINQCYMNILSNDSTITNKYRLLIACVQKRAFVKLKEV